jgi:hypothetical protein
MSYEAALCPQCATPMHRVVDHGIRYGCAACAGHLLGLVPFRHLLRDGEGGRIWVASEAGELTGACPFCGQPMREVPASAGGPAGMAVCRTCEQVWIPGSAEGWLADHAPHGVDGLVRLPVLPSECNDCGAPWQPDDMGRCPFCHAQLTAPALAGL